MVWREWLLSSQFFYYRWELSQSLEFETLTNCLALLFFCVKGCPKKKTVYFYQCMLLALKVVRERNVCGSVKITHSSLKNQPKWHILLIEYQKMNMFKCFINCFKKINFYLFAYFLLLLKSSIWQYSMVLPCPHFLRETSNISSKIPGSELRELKFSLVCKTQ